MVFQITDIVQILSVLVALIAVFYSNWNVARTIKSQERIAQNNINAEIKIKYKQKWFEEISNTLIEFLTLVDKIQIDYVDCVNAVSFATFNRIENKEYGGFSDECDETRGVYENRREALHKVYYKMILEFSSLNDDSSNTILPLVNDLMFFVQKEICLEVEIASDVFYEDNSVLTSQGAKYSIPDFLEKMFKDMKVINDNVKENSKILNNKKDILLDHINEYFLKEKNELYN